MRRLMPTVTVAAALLMLGGVPPAGAATKAQLQAKLLSLSNFPAGWAIDNATSPGGKGSACLKALKIPRKHDVEVSADFFQGAITPVVAENIEGGPNVAAKYRSFTKALGSCRSIGTVGAMSYPAVGTESSAYAVTINDSGIDVGVDVVAFRAGSDVASVVYETLSTPDSSIVEAFVNEAVDKIEGKPTTTPTTLYSSEDSH
jgi:hypothetical protein